MIDSESMHDSFAEMIEPLGSELGSQRSASAMIDFDGLSLSALQGTREAVCLTDALIDAPGPRISFVNDAYTDIFCCETVDVLGKNPRLGQGPLTNRHVLDRLRSHLVAGESVQAQAINYRLDRTTFRLRWTIDPIRRDGVVVGFIAFMRDVTADDRMRRRLAALDTLMDRGRSAASVARTERSRPVSVALSAALRPIVAEIGTANVQIGGSSASTQIDTDVLAGTSPTRVEVPIGSVGSIVIDVHPDAGDLFDGLAVSELAEHARWLLDLGNPA